MVRNVFISIVLASAMLFASFAAFAATVVVEDLDRNGYESIDMYLFDLTLTAADPTVTFGFDFDHGEGFEFTLTAPAEYDLFAIISTQADGQGMTIGGPSAAGRVFAGTSWVAQMNSDSFVSFTHWLSISVDGIPEALPFLPIAIGSIGQSVVMPATVVPVPAAIWLMGSVLMGLFASKRKQVLG